MCVCAYACFLWLREQRSRVLMSWGHLKSNFLSRECSSLRQYLKKIGDLQTQGFPAPGRLSFRNKTSGRRMNAQQVLHLCTRTTNNKHESINEVWWASIFLLGSAIRHLTFLYYHLRLVMPEVTNNCHLGFGCGHSCCPDPVILCLH